MLSALPEIKVIAIDPWSPVPNADEDYKDWDFKQIESDFWKNVGEHKDRCEMLRMTSFDAQKDCSMRDYGQYRYDMVFIDAGHDYPSCKQDIELWWPLVREGGYLCGHDLQHKFPGVMRAVADSFPLLDVAVFPDSVWCVEKRAGLKRAA